MTDNARRRRTTRLAAWINYADGERAYHRNDDLWDASVIADYLVMSRSLAILVHDTYARRWQEHLAEQERERALAERACEGCGVTFRPSARRHTRYCSPACRQRAYRGRRTAA